jgi:hypothetical protein
MSDRKKMAQENFCSECPQSHDCKTVYEQMGNSQGPNVVRKVLVAFLLPIAVFITALALFDHVLAGAITGKNIRTAAVFALAAGSSFIYIMIARAVNARSAKRRILKEGKGDTKSELKQD